jgi:hypothetical protein
MKPSKYKETIDRVTNICCMTAPYLLHEAYSKDALVHRSSCGKVMATVILAVGGMSTSPAGNVLQYLGVCNGAVNLAFQL